MNEIDVCCAECGVAGGVSLKACKSCMLVKYCNVLCQRNHWKKHKIVCKQRAAELHNELLFKDPPPKEDCPICFLPMPISLICCVSLPPANISSVPIYDYAIAHKELADEATEIYYPCCGKSICGGCVYSFIQSGNSNDRCPFCNSDRGNISDEEEVEEMMKRMEANDAGAIYVLAHYYYHGLGGLHQDREKAMELNPRAADLGFSKAHYSLGNDYRRGGDLKKAKAHSEAAAMAGHEVARFNLGSSEYHSGRLRQQLGSMVPCIM